MADATETTLPAPVAGPADSTPPPISAQTLPAPDAGPATTPNTPLPPPAQGAASELPPPTKPEDTPVSANDQTLLGKFKSQIEEPAKAAIAGPGTMLGADNAGPSFENWKNNPVQQNWEKTKDAFRKTLDSSLIVPANAISPEDAAQHPHIAAAERGVSDVVKNLTTPGSLALIVATSGADALPAVLEKTLAGREFLAPYAPKAAKVAKMALQGLGAYFTATQVADVIQAVPEVAQAVLSGRTDDAIRLATGAFINGAVATQAGSETYKSIRGSADAAAEASAMHHGEYADLVHKRQGDLQIAGARKAQIADLGRDVAPNIKDREWTTDYVEASRDRKLLAERQAETKAGPQPSEQIATAQGAETPLTAAAEKPPVEAETPNFVYRSRDVGEQGVPSASASQATASKDEARSYVQSRGNTTGKPQELVRIDLNKLTPEDYKKATGPNGADWIKFNKDLPEDAVEPLPTIKDGATIDPKIEQVVEQAGGIYHGQNKDGMVEITLPKAMSDSLEIPNKLKPFVSVTLHADDVTPEAVKSAMDEKFKAMGGKPAEPAPAAATEPLTPEELAHPASQQVLGLKAALEDAKKASAAHVVTPEERAKMVEQQDPTKQITGKHEKAIDITQKYINDLGKEGQKRGLLGPNQLRSNFVPHEWDFDDTSNPTRQRLYDDYHSGQQAGLVGKNKDYFALQSDYYGKMANKIADADIISKLKQARTNEGAPLAVPSGYVEGQHVATEGAQPPQISETDLKKMTKNGQLAQLLKNGDVLTDAAGKVFRYNPDHYVKAANLFESRPIGPTPIPPKVLTELGPQLAEMEKKGLVYKNEKGEYLTTEPLYARTPVYLHKDIADHFNSVVKPKMEQPTSFFGRAGKMYDDATGNMKSLLLSWSPFHRVTESMRMMESLGLVKGGKLAAQTNLGLAPKVDYFHLEPWQESAIRDGIVTSNPRGFSMSNVEEGVSAGEGTWGAKTYKLFDKGLEKLGVPEPIRNKLNLQKILTEDVFGPQGMITQAKFALYKDRKPAIAEQMSKDHPDWTPQEIDKHAGRTAARFANDKFGGLNEVTLGRTMQDQKWLRRALLAPDFLESTGRSVLDLASPYGRDLATKLIQFNIAHLLTTAGINYALHHNDEDNSVKGAVQATHLLDHPYGVVSADGKSVFGLRTTAEDFLHMINKPRDFAMDRFNPLVKAGDEIAEQRNQYGRKESLAESLKSIPKATLPIQVQNLVGLGPNTTTEPSAADQFMKSIGIQARPNRSNAEQLAIDKVSAKLQGTEARTGDALVRQQLKFNAEDKLRAALQMKDPEKKTAAVADAKHDIKNLAQRKILSPEEVKKVTTDAQSSRLKSIFNSLDPDDALDVWTKATDDEKKELGVAMNAKYLRWREKLAKDGQNVSSLNADDQKTLNEFREAATELATIRERPEPLPVQKSSKTAAKASPAAAEPAGALPAPDAGAAEALPAPELGAAPASLAAPKAPNIYKIGDLTPVIDDAAKKYRVPSDLISAMITQESGGDANAVSGKGAHGLMQLLPATAQQYGVKDINDPAQNIDAGAHYMADLLKRYNGDEAKALAAYNAGPEAVEKYNGVPPFRETREYIKAIQNR